MSLMKLLKLIVILTNKMFLKSLLRGVAAGTEHKSVLKGFDYDFIVDVGANRGQFALIMRHLYPNALIHSFEPLDEPAEIFKSVFSSDKKVFLHHCAIGSKEETKIIHVSKRDDSSSLLPIGENQSRLFPHTGESETRETNVKLLSDVISPGDITGSSLLKIDVQGFELEVLKGSESILNHFKYIYAECSFIELYEGQAYANEVIAFLNAHDFLLSGVYNICYDLSGKAVQADFFFKNKKHTN